MSDNKTKPSRPIRDKNSQEEGGIFGTAPPSVGFKVKTPGTKDIDGFAKFAQLIMYGIAMLAIWGGILSIAFAENATNQNFLILGCGGIISAIMALALVELQRRKGGDGLHSVHDYLLGIGFFFAAVGVLWGSRYLIGIAANNGIDWLLVEGIPYADENWSPSANGIYVQLIACTALIIGEYLYLKHLKGATSFGWSIITFTPLALVVAGVGPWLSWSGDIVSWELGISIISMSLLSMWLALESNNGLIFSIVAVVAGLIPLLYEILNENAPADGTGGALSLLVFIIIGQGFLAADERVRKGLMELTSIFLIAEILIAIIVTREGDLNLILGPIRESMLGDAATYINLQSVLWVTVLLAYFPAVHKQRIPWMPIGLAGSIWILEPGASLVAWGIALIVLPYMLIWAKATRGWVANATFIAAACSFFLQDSMNFWGDVNFIENEFVILIAVVLIIIGELSRSKSSLENWAHFVGVGIIVLSDSILINGEVLVSWLLVLYLTISSWRIMNKASITQNVKDRLEGSAALFISIILTIILTINDRLVLPLPENIETAIDGFNIGLVVLAFAIWLGFRRYKSLEFDIGNLFSWCIDSGKKNIPVYDMENGTWSVDTTEQKENLWSENGWGKIGRTSLIGSLLLLSISISDVIVKLTGNEVYWVLLMTLPLGILLWELSEEETVSSKERAMASWILVFMAVPISFELNDIKWKYENNHNFESELIQIGDVFLSNILFDLLLILGPLFVTYLLIRRGLKIEGEEAYNTDKWTYFGLLALALLDTSGGLGFVILYTIVIFNAIKYRHFAVLTIAPFTLILMGNAMVGDGDFIGMLLNSIDITNYDPKEITILEMPRFSCIIMALTASVVLGKSMIDQQKSNSKLREMPTVSAGVWLALGMWGVLPNAAWLLLIITIALTLQNWLSGKLNFIPYAPIASVCSLLVGFTQDSNFSDFTGFEILSYSLLGTGVFSLILHYLARSGLLYKWANKPEEGVSENATLIGEIISPNLDSIEGREKLIIKLQYWTMLSLLLSWDALFGIGTIIGAVWISWEIQKNGQNDLLLLMPALHAFALWNFIEQIDDTRWENLQNILVGIILIGEGLAFTYISSKSEIAWNWENFEFDNEKTYFDWLDRLGIMSILYIIIGIIWIMETANMDSLTWGIISIYLATVAIQGFQEETDSGWRRSIGGFGSILSLFILSFTIDGALYRSITWLALGIVAFGFGMLYMQRFGDQTEVFVEKVTEEEEEVVEEVTEEKKEVVEEVTEEKEEVVEEDIPEPITKQEDNLVETNEGFFFRLSPEIINNIRVSLKNTPHEGLKPILEFTPSGQIVLNFE